MAKFNSVPHSIEAFQFQKDAKIVPPKWFTEAYHRGEAQVTMSDKYGYYIIIYGEDQGQAQMEKAVIGDWICYMQYKNGSGGKIYILSDAKFRESYKAA